MHDRSRWTRMRYRASAAALLALLIGSAQAAAPQGGLPASRFDALRGIIVDYHVRSVEQLLPLLSPALRSGFVLVFDSRSVQEASLLDPRVLLFGNDARFIISFNGEARQRGFDVVETMEFDDASASFELREIRFPGGAGDEVDFSQANPARCAVCHGLPAHP